MSKYNVSWHNPSKTLIISDVDVEQSGDAQVVSHIVYGDLGEIPDAAAHPEPGQHLRNIARQNGVDDYDIVTVVNETDNDRLDKFVKEGDREKLERLRAEEAAKIDGSGSLPDGSNEEDDAVENADKVGPIGERHADEGTEDSTDDADKTETEKVELTDEDKAGDEAIGLPAYADITVKQLQEKLGDDGKDVSDKSTLYSMYRDSLRK